MIPDGIYFGLDEEAYHADEALGSSDHKALVVSPVQWRAAKAVSLMDALGLGPSTAPAKEQEVTATKAVGKAFGDAVDLMVLTPDLFDQRYVEDPECPPEYLSTIDDIRAALKELGVSISLPRSAKLYDHEVLASSHGLKTSADWAAARAELVGGRQVLSRRWLHTLRFIDRMLDMGRADYGGRSIREAVLGQGVAQVSVFWTDDNGVRCKCRFDWLRPGHAQDVKTFFAREGDEIVEAFWSAVARFAYDMQAAHYLEGHAAIRGHWENGRVFGDHDPAFLTAVVQAGTPTWSWIGIQTRGLPEADVFQLPVTAHSLVLSQAQTQIAEARKAYLEYVDRFGLDQPWVSTRGPIVMSDETAVNFLRRMGERGAKRWSDE